VNFEGSIGFAVVETTDDEVIMARKDELLVALVEVRKLLSYIIPKGPLFFHLFRRVLLLLLLLLLKS
jgi:hypothetical protein